MNFLETIIIAWQAMRKNMARTSLTVLGMIIGITTVIIVFSAGEGIKSLVLAQIESFGTDIIETEIKVPTSKKGISGEQQSATALVQGAQITTLTIDDMEDINTLPNINKGYAAILGQESVNYGSELRKGFLLGVSSSYIDIDKSELASGRFFSEAEDRSLARVTVLGKSIKEKLFGDSDPVGRFVKIRQSKYRVIGVMAERGAVFTINFDDYIYIPVRTMQKRILGINHVLYMVHQLEDISLADDTAEQARLILRENHDINSDLDPISGEINTGKDDFRVVTMAESMEILATVTDAITLLLLAIVAVSLVVGGVGIMNVMYVAVNERTGEIGLRKAVGAGNSFRKKHKRKIIW